jgi:hypothetical protein
MMLKSNVSGVTRRRLQHRIRGVRQMELTLRLSKLHTLLLQVLALEVESLVIDLVVEE